MARVSSRVARRTIAGGSLLLVAVATPPSGTATSALHPMPNTVIAVSVDDGGVTLDIAVPMPELRLAMQVEWPGTASALGDEQRAAFTRYFLRHVGVRSTQGVTHPVSVRSMTVWEAADANVGRYQELRLRMFALAGNGLNARDFTLEYDAVIHQVPNHFALVQITGNFLAGTVTPDRAVDVGVIRFNFSRDRVMPLRVQAERGSIWREFRSVVALGFRHVALGFDHVLFLVTLLIVAPLRVVDGRWSLFQGWRHASRRFLAISLAFTLGHSVALVTGAYELVRVPRAVVEPLIAASILVTAIHAIRPLFPRREWLIAAAFGTVHGLAFSEALAGLALGPARRAVAVAGFNIGIEGAQLVAMLCAVPLLFSSKWHAYHAIRVVTMVVAVTLAGIWILQETG